MVKEKFLCVDSRTPHIDLHLHHKSSVRDDKNSYAGADFYHPHPNWDHVEMHDVAFVPHEEDFF